MRLTALLLITALPALAAETPDLSLTVYSSAAPGSLDARSLSQSDPASIPGYALIRDRRAMTLAAGQSDVRFSDVAARIDPTTVAFTSRTDPAGTRVLEQNFVFDLVSPQKLLQRYIGLELSVELLRGDRVEILTGRLLSAQNGVVLALPGGEVQSVSGVASVRFPALPGGLIEKPTLVWHVDAKRGGSHDVQVAYQTQGLSWWSDYNITLGRDAKACRMDLAAWVSVINRSGASYPNAKLRLVAGEVNRAPAAPQQLGMMRTMADAPVSEAAAGFSESQLFEYHLYTLGRRTDLPDESTKQLELFPAVAGVACQRELVFTAAPTQNAWWGGNPNTDQGYAATSKGQAGAYLSFENSEAQKLGIPLPAGRIRVNQAAEDGTLEFIGEDRIDHTPRGETLRVKLGEAFDIVGERSQQSFAYDEAAKTLTESFEIRVRNRKKEATDVTIREYLYRWSNWTVTEQSHPHQKRDAQTIDFPVRIAADGEAVVRYTVVYRW